ncbi:MAG TPA: ABC transporter permease [Synergistales bacterium]|jgi:simple sugar transport system permease protein|nr:ABC transporter permease [Synergistaceae bacterium]HOO87123.1 ABC transporter permease [Synergistales bacterium]MDD3915562.1 ABC transporter permease [Synergistaceae bacterium]NLD95581.1 ABC transporter permease [Synergistaceae bacterium]HPE64649.1 ABC transporter permease [Synergistales bacterium]
MKLIQKNIVPIVFIILCTIGFQYSGLSWIFFANDLMTRLARNSFLVISLIIPVLAGMGLNFGIVLGAMAGQFAAFITVVHNLTGIGGFFAACVMAIPFAILFGWLTGILFNKAKGKEMITGLILGFFANGIYQLVCLIFIGWLIPISNKALLLPSGVGFVNTLDLKIWQYAIDKFYVFRARGIDIPVLKYLNNINIPVLTLTIVVLLCIAVVLLFRTKLGQDFRAVGQNRHIAEIAGIKVDRVRIIAVIFSTVLAAWGQLIFLQNIGNVQVYGSHVQVGTFAVAALLIGGATVSKATIGQALLGTVLFHALFIVSPLAGKNLMGSAQVGEYFRVFIAYGVIGIALALHAWQRLVKKQ